MRRVKGLHILSLLIAGLGIDAWVQLSSPTILHGPGTVTALFMIAGGCGYIAARTQRSHWKAVAESKLSATEHLECRVRELEALLAASALRSADAETALAGLAAGVGPMIELADGARSATPDNQSASSSRRSPSDRPGPDEHLVQLISHEARTPLATIHAYSELLLDEEPLDEATSRDFHNIIHAETERLTLVLDSLLNLARLDAGRLPVRPQTASFNTLAARVVHSVIALADFRQIGVELDLTAEPDTIRMDQDLLTQATRNLITHMVKHTPVGDRVLVRTRAHSADGHIRVEITGGRTGIPPKDLPSSLDSFYGGRDQHVDVVPPGAAGLALTRRVIETVHGGSTFAQATGQACTLGFALPLARACDQSNAGLVPTIEAKDE